MKSPDSSPLSPELLEDYIYGMLPQAELAALEARIEADPALKAQVEAAIKREYEAAGGSEAQLAEARAAFEARSGESLAASVRPFYLRPVYQVAAAVMVLLAAVGLWWWISRPSPYAELALAKAEGQALFETELGAPDAASAFEAGKVAFANQNYSAAIAAFQQVPSDASYFLVARYHLGLAYFLDQQFDTALKTWQQIEPERLDPNLYPRYAETLAWNQALALLATGQQPEAVQALEQLKNAKGPFSAKAAQVLAELPTP